MKRFFAVLLAMTMFGTTAYAAEKKVTKTAIPAQQEVSFDGHAEIMQCYNIDGYTYFRLRDVAQEVTDHMQNYIHLFNVSYDAKTNEIQLINWQNTFKREPYVPVEDAKPYVTGTKEKQAIRSTMPVRFGTRDIVADKTLHGYNIDGYTFYMLRELADLLDMHIEWCEEEKVIELVSMPWQDENGDPILYRKPAIYLYPEETTDVSVELEYDGALTTAYPAYNNGWQVTAQPDGTLINHADGREYSYLFWEGEGYGEMDFSQGFVVKGEDTVAFLQEKLAAMGMTPKEYNEFIVYWLPYMQNNTYNLISFQWENYDTSAKLHITPEPDHMLRVFMAFKPLEQPVSIPEQELPTLTREGFTVLEWGGAEVR